ncbi:hypothetical protein QVD17_14413 [Tagetes erecta]|uniref:Uncharacterized protein n=1 Tax=Tagetes erecta TaxID=13708 RepID=A0AAD8KY55_TARER|nr:hypothetical protein QVD17_14413 [Tagetes erecta]
MNPYNSHQSLLDTPHGDHVHTPSSPPPKSTNPDAPPSVSDLILRLLLISSFATLAIWANHEASKSFSITIINDAGKHSLPGKRFSIFYQSNDAATRIVLNTSRFVEHLLYPSYDHQGLQHMKKHINSVTLRLAPIKLPSIVHVSSQKPGEYVIILSPSIMGEACSHKTDEFVLAVLKGMARVWLWDGNGAVPEVVLNGMVEYITYLAGFRTTFMLLENIKMNCWEDEDPKKVAGFLKFYDHGGGDGEVIRRLNDGMKDKWDDEMVGDAVGVRGQHACASYDKLTTNHHYQASSM